MTVPKHLSQDQSLLLPFGCPAEPPCHAAGLDPIPHPEELGLRWQR